MVRLKACRLCCFATWSRLRRVNRSVIMFGYVRVHGGRLAASTWWVSLLT